MTRPPSAVLNELANRHRWRRLAADLLAATGAAALLGPALGHWTGAATAWQVTVAALVVLGGVAWTIARDRYRPSSARSAARHLDRRHPELEESAELLLIDDAEAACLPLLPRLQRARTAAAFATLFPTRPIPLPAAAETRATAAAMGCVALGSVLFILPPRSASVDLGSAGDPGAPAPTAPATQPFIRAAMVTIMPPAYTGRRMRRTDDLDLDVEEGAAVTWSLTGSHRVGGARLVASDGSSFAMEPGPGGSWTLRLGRAEQSMLYRLQLLSGDSVVFSGEDHRLTVERDAAPVIAVVRPAERSTIPFGPVMRTPVEVVVRDDYGVDSISMSVTISKGQGEGVRFQRLTLGFESRVRQGTDAVLARRGLDLKAFGLEPGDDLYFHIEATDRRPGRPNRSRSETVFLSIPDTSTVAAAEFAGLTLNLPPDYFRSQRQIIIDTERLLEEGPRLPEAVVRDRANGIGMDQGLLRLRYGEFLGDEFEENAGPTHTGREQAANSEANPPDAVAEATHEHDAPENATLLGPKVKDKLKAAVGEMWRAELHLRTARPKEALPYEYRALVLLKEVQQDARSYVKRVGFDPPPLEPDKKRLTGDLTKVRPPIEVRAGELEPAMPEVRRGLAAVLALARGSLDPGAARPMVEDAGNALAALAVEEPRFLPLLRDVRALLDSLQRGGHCLDCLARAERAFRIVLPRPASAPGTSNPGIGTLDRLYRIELERGSARP